MQSSTTGELALARPDEDIWAYVIRDTQTFSIRAGSFSIYLGYL